MPEIILTEMYKKKAIRFLKQHPEILNLYEKTLIQLRLDLSHPYLRLHKLRGKFQTIYSLSMNIKYQILLKFIILKDQILLLASENKMDKMNSLYQPVLFEHEQNSNKNLLFHNSHVIRILIV